MKTEVVTITPNQAQQIIETANIDNRRIRENNVKWLSEQMIKNEWMLTHQGIAFSENGKLLDGQHRLLAVIKANKPVSFMVTSGLPEDSFKVIDCGERRSLADLTHIDKKTVEVLRLAASAVRSPDFNNNKATAAQLLSFEDRGWGNLHRRYAKACPSHVATNAACFRLAACVAVVLWGKESEVFSLCQAMHQMRFGELPETANSFLRQISNGKISAARLRVEAYLKFLKVLQLGKMGKSRLVLHQEEGEFLWKKTRETLLGEAL